LNWIDPNNGDQPTCTESCPDEYYYITTDLLACNSCFETCLTCTDGLLCTSCDINGTTPYFTDTNECREYCNITEYVYEINGTKECHTGYCPNGTLKWINETNNNQPTCTETCPSEHYFITTDGLACEPCMDTCLTCANNLACATCDLNGNYSFFLDTGFCISECTDIQWLYLLYNEKKCFVSDCPSDSVGYIDPLNDYQPTCINSTDCPIDYYFLTADDQLCSSCYLACLTCNDDSEFNCTSCDNNNTYPYFTFDGQCVT